MLRSCPTPTTAEFISCLASASSQIGRRELLVGAAATGLAMTLKPNSAKASANERVNVCIIGVRGRGSGVGRNFAGLPDAQVTHIMRRQRDSTGCLWQVDQRSSKVDTQVRERSTPSPG